MTARVEIPWCRPVLAEDVVPPDAVWDVEHGCVFQFVDAAPYEGGDSEVLITAGPVTFLFDAGAVVLVAIDPTEAEAWNRQRAAEVCGQAETVGQFDWERDDGRGAA